MPWHLCGVILTVMGRRVLSAHHHGADGQCSLTGTMRMPSLTVTNGLGIMQTQPSSVQLRSGISEGRLIPPGEVTNTELSNAISGTSNNTNAVSTLDPPLPTRIPRRHRKLLQSHRHQGAEVTRKSTPRLKAFSFHHPQDAAELLENLDPSFRLKEIFIPFERISISQRACAMLDRNLCSAVIPRNHFERVPVAHWQLQRGIIVGSVEGLG